MRRLGLAGLLVAATTAAAAAGGAVVGTGWWVGAPVVGPWYASPNCLAYGVCAGWGWDDRRPLRRPVAPDPPVFEERELWGGSGSPWGYVRRLPPPTPESQIQPRYRDASTIRPEFAEPR